MPTEAEKKEESRARIEHLVITQSQILTVLVGLPGTEEKGMAGDISEMKIHMAKQNNKIMKNRVMIMSLITFLSGAGILDATIFHRVFGG